MVQASKNYVIKNYARKKKLQARTMLEIITLIESKNYASEQ